MVSSVTGTTEARTKLTYHVNFTFCATKNFVQNRSTYPYLYSALTRNIEHIDETMFLATLRIPRPWLAMVLSRDSSSEVTRHDMAPSWRRSSLSPSTIRCLSFGFRRAASMGALVGSWTTPFSLLKIFTVDPTFGADYMPLFGECPWSMARSA